MIADALRKSILQQAIQGKLSEQLPSDGDARALLREIQAEKLRLVAEKKIKAAPPLPPITADEIPFDIPQNWCWVRFGDIVTIQSSKRVFEKDYVANGIPFFRSKEIGDLSRNEEIKTKLFISETHYKNLKNTVGVPQINDILITSVGSIGNAWICDGRKFYYKDGNITQICNNVNLFSKYVVIFIRSPFFSFQVNNSVSGTAYSALTIIKLKNFLFPLPPLAEQKRIVAKLEKLMPLLERLDAAEKKLAALNKAFPDQLRKSILQQAIQGKLSKQLPTDGDARQLLREIQAEKLRLIAEKKIKAAPPLPPITADEIPFDIPQNWCWVQLGDICILSKGKKTSVGKLPYLDAKYLRGLKEKILIDSGIFVQAGKKLILVDGENSSEIFTAPENGYMGSTFQTLDISQNILVDYFQYFMATKKDYYKKNKRGSAIPHLDRNLFFSTLVPLPPLEEQKRIVAKLEKVLPLCDRLAEKLK